MKIVESGVLARLAERLTFGRSVTKASISTVEQIQQRKQQFETNRKKIEESIERGARLTKHRISI